MSDPGSRSLGSSGERARGSDRAAGRRLGAVFDRWNAWRLSSKLILLSTALTTLLVAGGFLALNRQMTRTTERVLIDTLARDVQLLLDREREASRRLLWASSLITQNPTLRAAIETYRIESGAGGSWRIDLLSTIRNEMVKIAAGLDRDLLIVTDDAAKVLASAGPDVLAPEPGRDLSGTPLVRRALDPDERTRGLNYALLELEGRYFVAGTVPIEMAGYVIGTLTLADCVNERYVRALQASYGSEALIVVDGRVVASTLAAVPPGVRLATPVRLAEDAGAGRAQTVTHDGETYVAAGLSLGSAESRGGGEIVLLHSLSAPMREQNAALLQTMLVYGLVTVLLGAAIMWALSRSLLHRLERFVVFMRSVAQSGDYSRRFGDADRPRIRGESANGSRGGDELAHLADSFDEMMSQIEYRDEKLREQVREREQAERALDHKEEQLRQSQKMEALGALAGGVAHDFNNLLTVITGYSDLLLLRMGDGHELRSRVQEIKNAGKRAGALTQQLLAFSRKQVLAPRIVDLNDVVTGVEKMLRRLIAEDVVLGIELAADLWSVKADPGQVEQILMNLAVNARDAMPDGGRLHVRTANLRGPESRVRRPGLSGVDCVLLSVRDTGTGMSPETRERIFEPFFTTKDKGKGTGLGLSTVYGIVRQSGGWIWVDSEPGAGTTVEIYLPRVRAEAEALDDSPTRRADLRGSETVLLVEDEDQVRRFVRDVLEANGYKVLEACDGLDALTVARKHDGTIDLMLTDVVMPHMNGHETYERLCALRPDLKVLFTSGYLDRHLAGQRRSLEEGAAFLRKPFTAEALTVKVREVLAQAA